MGEKTKEPTLADLHKTIQEGFQRYEDRLEALESKVTTQSNSEENLNEAEENSDEELEMTPPNPNKGFDSFYSGYNPQTGLHDLVPKISKLVTRKIEKIEQKREERENLKDRKVQEQEAAKWLRGLKDHSKELEREVIQELKKSELGKMSPVAAVRQAYSNVTGVRIDEFGKPVVKEDSQRKVEDVDVKSANNSQKESSNGLNADSYSKLTDNELMELERTGKIKEHWANVVGGQA